MASPKQEKPPPSLPATRPVPAAQIRQRIYALGAQMPTERELMELYDVSRNTVRQALDQLAAKDC